MPMPSQMREVSKEQFFAAMKPLNVHPRPTREETFWEMQDGGRRCVGYSLPGYACEGRASWFLPA